MIMNKQKKIATLTAAMFFAAAVHTPVFASLEDDKAEYDRQAEERLRQSDELRSRINTVSEEKRLIDEEADAAVADYRAVKADLNVILDRIDQNEDDLYETEQNYKKKVGTLRTRVRDIYVNGQISYLDVLFGAKDFQDLMTRMDLLKHVVAQDYDLVQAVLGTKQELENIRQTLERDRAEQEIQVARAEEAKERMEAKQRKQREMLDKLENDKATVDRQYDELMAASKQIEEMLRQSRIAAAQPSFATGGDSGNNSGGGDNGGGGGSGAFVWPLSGPITSEYGWRTHPIFGTQRYHSGLDIGGDYGLPIVAAASGTVEYAGWISGYGNTVIISHGGGISTLYGHNQSLAVGVGQSVSTGQTIAYCGSTGNSTGPHCHFEVRVNGEPTSPWTYL